MSIASKTLTPQDLSDITFKLRSRGVEPAEATRGQIAIALKVTDRRARTIQEKFRGLTRGSHQVNGSAVKKPESVQDVTENTWAISLPKTRIKTVEELLAHFEVDNSIWE